MHATHASGLEPCRWSRSEYGRMISRGLLGPEDRVELIDGEILTTAPTAARTQWKGSLYARARIPEYWIVSLGDRVLEVYRDPAPSAAARYGSAYADVRHLRPPEEVSPLRRRASGWPWLTCARCAVPHRARVGSQPGRPSRSPSNRHRHPDGTDGCVVPQVTGVAAEPLLVESGPQAMIAATQAAGLVVLGLSERWRREGLGARLEVARRVSPPALLVRGGVRPSGIAPRDSLTRFTSTVRSDVGEPE